ncbi:MAG TPA: helix-turn-helix transcriptional regulator [Ktedonobacterales bacterium]|jgi:transcriptional regulator with XRE-family HTH domain
MNTRDKRERKTIAEWRKGKWLTQEELGKMVGVSLTSISSWELGVKQPRFKNLRALAAALGIEPDQIILIEGKDDPELAA